MSASAPTTARTDRTAVQKAALAVGIVFLAVGVLGFIPGITTNYSALAIYSHHSNALLLGIFQVSILHNIVHLLFGVAGLLLARTVSAQLLGVGRCDLSGAVRLWPHCGPEVGRQFRSGKYCRRLPSPGARRRHDRAGPGLDSPESGRGWSARQLTDPMDPYELDHSLLGRHT